MSRVQWTDDRIERLRAFYVEGTPLKTVAGFFGTNTKAVRSAAVKFGIATPRPSTGWIKTRGPEARQMYLDGMTYAAIAEAMGPGVTRGSVSGFLDRAGLRRDAVPRRSRPRLIPVPKPPRATSTLKCAAQGGAVHILNRVEAPQKPMGKDHGLTATATLATLGAHACKWPIGDPRDADFGFCGRAREHHAYCEAHRKIAYQPEKVRQYVEGATRRAVSSGVRRAEFGAWHP